MNTKYKAIEMPDAVIDNNRTAAEILERATAGGVTIKGEKFTWQSNIKRAAEHFASIQDGRFAAEIPSALKIVSQYLVPVK